MGMGGAGAGAGGMPAGMEGMLDKIPPQMRSQIMGPDGKPDMAKVSQMAQQMGMGDGAGGIDMAKMQQMMGGMGMGGGSARPAPVSPAVHNKLNNITSHEMLATYIKDYPGVICNFGDTSYCPPCKQYKPIYTADASNNTNKNLIYCYIDTKENKDIAQHY